MGQKVNPNSYRLQINKNWGSRWFSKREYPKMTMEDFNIRKLVKAKYNLGTIEKIEIERERGGDVKVIIKTPKPGIIIGRNGQGSEDLKKYLEDELHLKIKIEVFEVSSPETSAQIIGENIAYQIAKRISYRRAINMAIEKAKDNKVSGIKITISGRLGGVEIARRESFSFGSIPTQVLKSVIDYAKVDALTKYGIIGIKIWVYMGE
jgi:small subunit ribosomal protein S3